jgi:hypothetical protein
MTVNKKEGKCALECYVNVNVLKQEASINKTYEVGLKLRENECCRTESSNCLLA